MKFSIDILDKQKVNYIMFYICPKVSLEFFDGQFSLVCPAPLSTVSRCAASQVARKEEEAWRRRQPCCSAQLQVEPVWLHKEQPQAAGWAKNKGYSSIAQLTRIISSPPTTMEREVCFLLNLPFCGSLPWPISQSPFSLQWNESDLKVN